MDYLYRFMNHKNELESKKNKIFRARGGIICHIMIALTDTTIQFDQEISENKNISSNLLKILFLILHLIFSMKYTERLERKEHKIVAHWRRGLEVIGIVQIGWLLLLLYNIMEQEWNLVVTHVISLVLLLLLFELNLIIFKYQRYGSLICYTILWCIILPHIYRFSPTYQTFYYLNIPKLLLLQIILILPRLYISKLTERISKKSIKLEKSNASIIQILDSLRDGGIIYSKSGNLIYQNPKSEEAIYGLKENNIKKKFKFLLDNDDRSLWGYILGIIENPNPKKHPYILQTEFRTTQGFYGEGMNNNSCLRTTNYFWISIICGNFLNNMDSLAIILTNTTVYKEVEEYKGEITDRHILLRTLSNKLRGSLNSIHTLLTLIYKNYQNSHKYYIFGEYLGKAARESYLLKGIINNMADYSLIKLENFTQIAYHAYIGKMLFNIVQSTKRDRRQDVPDASTLVITYKIDKALEEGISIDQIRISQIICAMLESAFRRTVRGSIILGAKLKGNSLRVSITDRGSGIRPRGEGMQYMEGDMNNWGREEINKFLHRWGYVEVETVGLYLAHSICLSMGGDLHVQTSTDGYTKLIASLPLLHDNMNRKPLLERVITPKFGIVAQRKSSKDTVHLFSVTSLATNSLNKPPRFHSTPSFQSVDVQEEDLRSIISNRANRSSMAHNRSNPGSGSPRFGGEPNMLDTESPRRMEVKILPRPFASFPLSMKGSLTVNKQILIQEHVLLDAALLHQLIKQNIRITDTILIDITQTQENLLDVITRVVNLNITHILLFINFDEQVRVPMIINMLRELVDTVHIEIVALTTRHMTIQEIVDNELAAILIKPIDVHELLFALTRFLTNSTQY